MVQPEGYPEESEPRRGVRGAALAGGAIVVVIIALLIGRLSSPGLDLAMVTTTTTTTTTLAELTPPFVLEEFTVADIEVGKPLDWTLAHTVEGLWPLAIIEHRGELFLFGTTDPDWRLAGGSGLLAWASPDGARWEPIAPLDSLGRASAVASTPQGLVAAGERASDGAPVVWISEDGVSWGEHELPTDTLPPPWRTRPYLAGGTAETLIVFGHMQLDIARWVAHLVPEKLRAPEGLPFGASWAGPPWRVTVQGPLDLTLLELTAEDLGLTDDELASLINEEVEYSSKAWVSSGGSAWAGSSVEPGWVATLFNRPGEDLMALAYRDTGPILLTSADGLFWEEAAAPSNVQLLMPWGDRWIGHRHGSRAPQIVHSDDLSTWESFGVEDLFPDALHWEYHPIAAGGAGVAGLAQGYVWDDVERAPDPPVIMRDGFRLSLDDWGGSIRLRGQDVAMEWPLHSDEVAENLSVDMLQGTIEFLDPETGDHLVSFTIEEIERAQEEWLRTAPWTTRHQGFLFSPDGEEWSLSNLSEDLGEFASMVSLTVTDTSVVAVVLRNPWLWGAAFPDLEVEVWVGRPRR